MLYANAFYISTVFSVLRKSINSHYKHSIYALRYYNLSYNIATMPTPIIDLKPFQALISTWFNNDILLNDIAKRLANEHSVNCTSCTIERRLKE